jgi:hypothetical protein
VHFLRPSSLCDPLFRTRFGFVGMLTVWALLFTQALQYTLRSTMHTIFKPVAPSLELLAQKTVCDALSASHGLLSSCGLAFASSAAVYLTFRVSSCLCLLR